MTDEPKTAAAGSQQGPGHSEKTLRKRRAKTPAKFSALKRAKISELPEGFDGDVLIETAATGPGPAHVRKAVLKERISGRIECWRGPVWTGTANMQEVFAFDK